MVLFSAENALSVLLLSLEGKDSFRHGQFTTTKEEEEDEKKKKKKVRPKRSCTTKVTSMASPAIAICLAAFVFH